MPRTAEITVNVEGVDGLKRLARQVAAVRARAESWANPRLGFSTVVRTCGETILAELDYYEPKAPE
jgi:hypothetical protein